MAKMVGEFSVVIVTTGLEYKRKSVQTRCVPIYSVVVDWTRKTAIGLS